MIKRWKLKAGNALFIAPGEKEFEGACVAVDALTKAKQNHALRAIKARKSLDFRRNQGFWWR